MVRVQFPLLQFTLLVPATTQAWKLADAFLLPEPARSFAEGTNAASGPKHPPSSLQALMPTPLSEASREGDASYCL